MKTSALFLLAVQLATADASSAPLDTASAKVARIDTVKSMDSVKSVLARRAQCAHWAGEEPYDRVRSIEIATAIRRLRCSHIDAEQARLRRRYSHKPAILRLLNAADPQ